MPAQQVLRIFLLLSGKTNNVVINGLRSALPLARARKPNNHIGECAKTHEWHAPKGQKHIGGCVKTQSMRAESPTTT